MQFKETNNWEDPQGYRGMLFFAQRFDELTWAYTLDSFRASTTNAPFLVDECIRNLNLYQSLNKSTKAVEHILEETRDRFRKNIIVRKCISLPLERYFEFDTDEPEHALDRLTMLAREVSPHAYLASAKACLIDAVPTHKKSDIDFLANELATTLLNIGFSSQYLNVSCREVFFQEGASKIIAV